MKNSFVILMCIFATAIFSQENSNRKAITKQSVSAKVNRSHSEKVIESKSMPIGTTPAVAPGSGNVKSTTTTTKIDCSNLAGETLKNCINADRIKK
jgi:hypothetical protein